jgi:hypothetical protein
MMSSLTFLGAQTLISVFSLTKHYVFQQHYFAQKNAAKNRSWACRPIDKGQFPKSPMFADKKHNQNVMVDGSEQNGDVVE